MERLLAFGLGNPGSRYSGTRHNIGFDVIEEISERHGIPLSKRRFSSVFGEGKIGNTEIMLIKPLTFMNLCGQAVASFLKEMGWDVSSLVVVHDDMDLLFMTVRVKKRGGDGGHRGLRSIMEEVGSENFTRIRMGIGRPPEEMDPMEFVLSPFSREEAQGMAELIEKGCQALEMIATQGVIKAMNFFNRRAPSTGIRDREREC